MQQRMLSQDINKTPASRCDAHTKGEAQECFRANVVPSATYDTNRRGPSQPLFKSHHSIPWRRCPHVVPPSRNFRHHNALLLAPRPGHQGSSRAANRFYEADVVLSDSSAVYGTQVSLSPCRKTKNRMFYVMYNDVFLSRRPMPSKNKLIPFRVLALDVGCNGANGAGNGRTCEDYCGTLVVLRCTDFLGCAAMYLFLPKILPCLTTAAPPQYLVCSAPPTG